MLVPYIDKKINNNIYYTYALQISQTNDTMNRLKAVVLCLGLIAAGIGKVSSLEQTFAIEPKDQSVVVNTVTTLPCRVSDLAGQLQWTKDDFALGTNRNLSYHGYPRYTMTGSDSIGKSQYIEYCIIPVI